MEVALGRKSYSKALGIIGIVAFIAGFIIAFFAGIFLQSNAVVILILMLLGILVGSLNITTKELMTLVVASIALIIVATAGFEVLNNLVYGLGDAVNGVINYLARLMAPAAVISAIRQIVIVGRPGD